jgi:hypothetical protein
MDKGMKLENLEDVKLFIEWCKNNKVKSFKNGSIEFELSEISFVQDLDQIAPKVPDPVEKFEENQQKEEDDELLFWSSER